MCEMLAYLSYKRAVSVFYELPLPFFDFVFEIVSRAFD